MPAPLDLLMAAALRRAAVPYWVVVHDADAHPGDGFPLQMRLQRRLVRGAAGVVALSAHVAQRLRGQGLAGAGTRRRLVQASLPPALPLPGEVAMPPPGAHGGPLRLLSFGRLLPYKGLDLLAEALRRIGPRPDLQVRVVGRGPESPPLEALRALPGVVVENRWVAEEEVPVLLGWADALVLSHREASQSGVAVGALAAGRRLVATRVGGLEEQVGDDPLALLCDPTAESIAGALQHLLAAPTRPPAVPRTPERAWSTLAAQIVSALHE
jgi:glycosyltransferase involved in cell wall biosynthesis